MHGDAETSPLAPPARDAPAVCVAAAPSGALGAAVRDLCAHTPAGVPIVLACDPADADAVHAAVASLADGRAVRVVAESVAAVAASLHPADVAVCDGRHRVGPGWLEALRDAAASDTTVATASALTTAAGPTAIGRPDAWRDGAADALRRGALRTRPRLERPAAACAYVRRSALELAGPLDDGFAERCSAAGLLHVAADDVLVGTPAAAADPPPPENTTPMELIALRRAAQRPLDRALAQARRAVEGMSVTIDGRILTGAVTGTQVHALELIAALHRTGAVRLRVVVPPDLGDQDDAVLAALGDVEQVGAFDVGPATRPSTLVHRPYQVSTPNDLLLLRAAGERLVVTHQDLLGYHDAAYHGEPAEWEAHRRLTREALGAADAVVALSEHAARDLLAEELVARERLHVVAAGTDHVTRAAGTLGSPPPELAALEGRPYLLCVGTDLRHKNRPFAIDLLAALRRRGWDGGLVFAGPHVAHGSSRADEERRLAAAPELAARVVDLGPVPEPAKAWLYRHAAAVAYPTTYEGFGLIPFEAAAAGTPSLFAHRSALVDLLPAETALLVPWDAEASAARAHAVLDDPDVAQRQVAAVRAAGERLTWDRAAAALVDVYEQVLSRPVPEVAPAAWAALEAEARLHELLQRIGPTGDALVGRDGLLPEDAQRVLTGLLRRPGTRAPTLAALRALGRVRGGGGPASR